MKVTAIILSLLLLIVSGYVAALGHYHLRGYSSAGANLVVIGIDTLRADHLSCYGYERNTTPTIDGVAAEGVRFDQTMAPAPWTLSSYSSLVTGLYPSRHGAYTPGTHRNNQVELPSDMSDDVVTLAEVLKDAGYRTFGISANGFLRFNFPQGLDQFTVVPTDADVLTDGLLAWLNDASKGRFFAFINYNDLHVPTDPPPPYDTLYPTLDGKPHDETNFEWSFGRNYGLANPGLRIYKSHKLALYDGALRFVDDQIARIVDFIDSRGLRDNTVIAVVSDHGEEFWDHPLEVARYYEDPRGLYGIGHGHTHFQELLRVPFIICGGNVPSGLVIEKRVGLVDVLPTLLDLIEIESPADIDGRTLLPFLQRRWWEKDRELFAEAIIYGSDRRTIYSGRYKLIYSPDEPDFLFDLMSDPGEKKNLVSDEPAQAAQLMKRLHEWTDAVRPETEPPKRLKLEEISPAIREQLRAMGYLN